MSRVVPAQHFAALKQVFPDLFHCRTRLKCRAVAVAMTGLVPVAAVAAPVAPVAQVGSEPRLRPTKPSRGAPRCPTTSCSCWFCFMVFPMVFPMVFHFSQQLAEFKVIS